MKIDETEDISYPEDNLNLSRRVHIAGELVNTGSTILLKGKVDTVVELDCSRCLKKFNYPVKFDIEEEYSRTPAKVSDKREDELQDEDFVFEVGSNNTIDVSEAVRQDLLTEIPIKPLCEEKCKGV